MENVMLERALIKGAVQRQIFCQFTDCGQVLDMRSASLVEIRYTRGTGSDLVMHAKHLDAMADTIEQARAHPLVSAVMIHDGREAFRSRRNRRELIK